MGIKRNENTKINDKAGTKKTGIAPVSKYRRALPQVLATAAQNLVLLDMGITLAFPTLVIPTLFSTGQELSTQHTQASWFGSLIFICQPIGSILSGMILKPLGRKNSMLLVNIPHTLAWCLVAFGASPLTLYIAIITLGLDTGFMEAPVITYIGEISEPSLRGVLTSFSGLSVSFGIFIEFLLGKFFSWKTVALINVSVPIISIISISLIPETPIWLISKDRIEDAEKSLCWLRGWVPSALVQTELNELIRYNETSKLNLEQHSENNETSDVDKKTDIKLTNTYCNSIDISDELPSSRHESIDEYAGNVATRDDSKKESVSGDKEDGFVESVMKTTVESTNGSFETVSLADNNSIEQQKSPAKKPTLKKLVKDMIRPQMLRPLALVVAYFIFQNTCGFSALTPYLIKIFDDMRFPVNVNWATVIISAVGFSGIIANTITVAHLGKRILSLVSLAGTAFSLLGLSVYSYLSENGFSEITNWTPFILYIFYAFFFYIGLAPIPWMLLSEVLPFRGREFASGFASATSYIAGFIASKSFLDLKNLIGYPGVFCTYGVLTLIGLVYIYFKLPETEGRSLEDIEHFYNQENRGKTINSKY